ncbi:hypothetical protein KSS87_016998 [Heliosperma pusillum]|nr:hypothetical protein KSS87_016998 [Heliosperma pusillum]
MRGHGSFRVGSGTSGEFRPCTINSGKYLWPRISGDGNETVKKESPDEVNFQNHEDGSVFASWKNDSSYNSSHFSEDDRPLNQTTKAATEKAVIKKLLHFEDKVTCKVRARRGCATQPRSIAERVRRNRISERMRNLQELVPHMDKVWTNVNT